MWLPIQDLLPDSFCTLLPRVLLPRRLQGRAPRRSMLHHLKDPSNFVADFLGVRPKGTQIKDQRSTQPYHRSLTISHWWYFHQSRLLEARNSAILPGAHVLHQMLWLDAVTAKIGNWSLLIWIRFDWSLFPESWGGFEDWSSNLCGCFAYNCVESHRKNGKKTF